MMNPPRAKRRPGISREPPFPIPIASLMGHQPTNDDWSMCFGTLHGNAVVVCDQNHKEKLFYMGFFGKGSLSRGIGNIHRDQPSDGVKIMSRRVYEYHQSWKDSPSNDYPSCQGGGVPDVRVLVQDSIEEGKDDAEDEGADVEVVEELKCDPYPLTENLYLSTSEAFFLSYGLGCLLVTDKDKKCLNLEDMWTRYCALDPGFVTKYVAYHHFRSKGWVVRVGMKFGVDFLLYKEGPPFYHSSYAVIIKPVDCEAFKSLQRERPSSWWDLAGINRINEHAIKELLYCYVIMPSESSNIDLKCPTCIPHFKVQEILIQRWVASKERESGNLSD